MYTHTMHDDVSLKSFRCRHENHKIVFKVSYVEIYLEEMNDLLSLGGQASPQLREDKDGNTVLSGVEEREVATLDDAVQCLIAGSHSRKVSSSWSNL